MNQDLIKQELQTWLIEFVEKPNPLLGNWAPCPYARQSRINDKIKIEFINTLGFVTEVYKNLFALDTYDVIVLCFNHKKINPVILQDYIKILNTDLLKKNIVVLEDHPDLGESINGVDMNFNKCGLLFIQQLDKLNTAADQLKEKGYYNTWSKENIDNVVSWRYQ